MKANDRAADETSATGRRSRGRPALPVARIITTALQIVDEDGGEALSMRTLAQRLDSSTATLYRHFANRTVLVARVVDHVFGEVDLAPDVFATMNWDEACRTVAEAMFDALGRHRNVAPLLVGQIPIGPNALILRERCLARLLGSGFPPPVAARAYATLARFVLGFAIQLAGPAGQTDDGQASTLFHGLDPSEFPATLTVADSLPVPLADEFTFGLELIINGLRRFRVDG
ncbi:TetR/AcrR family transcriptional regulator [Kutzneria buriramensis]|uniref:AcrR family transcriptional regulator n=1 Tax=Kutzneria buriramensis TaxID=1045776 RepID=A0A3E0GZ81_9PSEU|nr:TetR/AcrR family transcriptional regulator [Kutzneria buriramensis]REH35654.1 AcrR family transcriptional regulator [Kutzneria buriramensis]